MDPLTTIPENHLLCRYQRHAWRYVGMYQHPTRKSIKVVLNICRDCRCLREQAVDKKGELQGRRYEYPEGYLLIGAGKHRIMPIDVRREMLRRFRAAPSRDALLAKNGRPKAERDR